MLKSGELREKMKLCLSNIEEFSTRDLKEWLKAYGYIYNVDYEVNAFSNAIAYLTKKNYISSVGEKGKYMVVKKDGDACWMEENERERMGTETDNEEKKKEESVQQENGEQTKSEQQTYIEEAELEELRGKIKKYIEGECRELEKILDSEKPSIYGHNRRTYNDIIELILYLRNFEFSVEKNNL